MFTVEGVTDQKAWPLKRRRRRRRRRRRKRRRKGEQAGVEGGGGVICLINYLNIFYNTPHFSPLSRELAIGIILQFASRKIPRGKAKTLQLSCCCVLCSCSICLEQAVVKCVVKPLHRISSLFVGPMYIVEHKAWHKTRWVVCHVVSFMDCMPYIAVILCYDLHRKIRKFACL